MQAAILFEDKVRYYNTSTAKHIYGVWDNQSHIIKELHVNKNGFLFFAIYDEQNQKEYIKTATKAEALSFLDECGKNRIPVRWFPNGKQILQNVINDKSPTYGIFED